MTAVSRKEAIESLFTRLAQSYLGRGVALFHAGDFEAALVELDKAKNLLPDDPYIHYMIGRIHLDGGDLLKARFSLLRARSLSRAFIDVNYQLGQTYLRMGVRHMRKARRCFEAELGVHGGHGRAHQALAEIHRLQGRPEEAAAASRSAAQCGYRTLVRNTQLAIAIAI